MMTNYSVNQRVPEFRGPDGLFLNIDSAGILLLCRMDRPTSNERRAFNSSQPIKIGMGTLHGILVWTVGFGDLQAMDCTYSPQIVPAPPELENPEEGQGYAMTVILADGATGRIEKLRLIGLPHDFSIAMKKMYDEIRNRQIDYRKSIAAIYSQTTQQLDDQATVRCVLM